MSELCVSADIQLCKFVAAELQVSEPCVCRYIDLPQFVTVQIEFLKVDVVVEVDSLKAFLI